MHNKLQQYMSELAANMEKEGDAIKEYESFVTRLQDDIHWCECRLNDEGDDEMMREPLTEEDEAHLKKTIEDSKKIMKDIQEIIGDELNHTVILAGLIVKYGKVPPADDGLAGAVMNITNEGKEDDDNDAN